MIQKLSYSFAVHLKQIVPHHPASVPVIAYGISFVLNTSLIVGGTILIGLWTGRLPEVITAMIGFALLRRTSGGLHLKSGIMCIVVSTSLMTAISFASFDAQQTQALTLASAALAAVFAPSGIQHQSKLPAQMYPLLKIMSVIVIISNLAIGSATLAAAFLIQTMTLIHAKGGESN